MTILPVFPLPNTVFFPDTLLPLHIFEPRYREMIADVTEGDGRFVVSLADGDDFHSVGTVGIIRELTPLADGRSTLQLEAESRVTLVEMPSPAAYRLVRTEPRSETDPQPTVDTERARLELIATLGLLKREVRGGGAPGLAFDDAIPFRAALNAICSSLPIEARLRQLLLEEDDLMRRHELATDHLESVIEAVRRVRIVGAPPAEPETLN